MASWRERTPGSTLLLFFVLRPGKENSSSIESFTLTELSQRAIILMTNHRSDLGKTMMNRLRGRSLAHPGCLIGITAGLTIGIVLAGVLATTLNVDLNLLLLTWFGLTIGLGVVGWIVGARLSAKFPALEEEKEVETPLSDENVQDQPEETSVGKEFVE